MNCPMCNQKNIIEKVIKHTPELKGENLVIYSGAYLCAACDFTWTNDAQMDELRQKSADEYRRIHGLLTSQDIKQMRSSLQMSQDEFAKYVGVGLASIKRYESYKIQDYSIDQLIRLKCDSDFALSNGLEIALKRPVSKLTGMAHFSWRKMKALILLFINQAESPLFLNKILFYIDFFHFKKCGTSISGSAYAKLEYGPCPDQQKAIFTRLLMENAIVELSKNKLMANEKVPMEIFSADEKETIAQVMKFVENNGLDKIYNMSHEEKAYTESSWCKEIDYDHAKDLKIDF